MTTASNKTGRPKKLIAADKLPLITELAGRGVSEGSIAKACGISPRAFQNRKKEFPEIGEALEAGRCIEHDALVNVLFEAATVEKNLTACLFLLKCHFGYREGESQQQGGGGVVINIAIPGAMSPDQYIEVVNGTTETKRISS